MKYKKLENLEAGWKWLYLMKKSHEGHFITKYKVKSEDEHLTNTLQSIENQPELINEWISEHLSPDLVVKLDQAIRARRKRFFNAEHQTTRKKSIDLEYSVWQRLSKLSKRREKTLSETIIQLIEDAEEKDKYAKRINTLRNDIEDILKN
ncbi:macrodomain Ter protein MatP [Thorsellia anophelis]|nr:macrodomain Ter protein MatP [Thorsellia anophelis]